MNSSDHLHQKKYNIQNSQTNSLLNSSIMRQTKTLVEQDNIVVTINPQLFNSKIKYYYTVNNSDVNNKVLTHGGKFPLLLYNSSNQCSIENLKNQYSISKINLFLGFLQNDEYDKVFNELTVDETQKILYDLYDTKRKVGQCYHGLINMYEKMFKSIRYFYFLEGELRNQQNNCEKYKEDSIILNDMSKLKEYIKQLQSSINDATDMSIQAETLTVKPEYIKYIQLYGVPYKAMFDPVLLQEIKDSIYK
jgi:hypothetical protein